MKQLCYVERNEAGKIIRIYRRIPPQGEFDVAARPVAVAEIRKQVFERSGGQCEYCGKLVNHHFHMHEKTPRGRGGEISLSNCVALCADCHIGPRGEHGTRRPQFSKST